MAKNQQKNKALKMRKLGMSYSQIKEKIGVSKSSLSVWLREYPLSDKKINDLRANSPKRIEKFRNTMMAKREAASALVYKKMSNKIGKLSQRDVLIGGIFLYWGEGSKSADYVTSVSNTDPNVLKFFLRWLSLFGVDKNKLSVTLHLYKDMNIKKEVDYWVKELNIPRSCMRNPYIKDSKLSGLSYKNGFGHGTCNIRYHDKGMWQDALMALKYVRNNSVV